MCAKYFEIWLKVEKLMRITKGYSFCIPQCIEVLATLTYAILSTSTLHSKRQFETKMLVDFPISIDTAIM